MIREGSHVCYYEVVYIRTIGKQPFGLGIPKSFDTNVSL